jgi:hypothetical protein
MANQLTTGKIGDLYDLKEDLGKLVNFDVIVTECSRDFVA